MMFFYLFVLSIFFTSRNVQSIKQNLNFDDDLFYGDPLSLKKLQINRLKDQFTKGKLTPSTPNIKNLNDYFSNYNLELSKPTDFIAKEPGKCMSFYRFKDLFFNDKNKKEIEENLNSVSNFLNELNYFFKDEYGNLLVFSVCKNLFSNSNAANTNEDNDNYIRCFQRFVFISKIDFSYYSFKFSGERIPSLINFSVDFTVDEFSHKRYLFLFGGIDKKGNHNSDLFKFDIDYAFGNINIKKITSQDNNWLKNKSAPQGLSEASYTVLQYKKENLNYKKNYLSIIFGGNNDESISNKLFAYIHETSSWLTHDFPEDKSIIPRKGHSAVIIKGNLDLSDSAVNEEVISTFNILLFGGKSVNTYLNDVSIIKVFYEVLGDKMHFKYSQLINNKDIIGDFPEPREGHKSFIENDYLFIYGGCNYSIKKCYFENAHKLNLKSSPFKWERENINYFKFKQNNLINVKISFNNLKTGEKISNLVPFKNSILSFGLCEKNEDDCRNQFNFIVYNSDCLKDQIENNQCFLESENTDNRFDWVYKCQKKNKNSINDDNNTRKKSMAEKQIEDSKSDDKKKIKGFFEGKNSNSNHKGGNKNFNILNTFLQKIDEIDEKGNKKINFINENKTIEKVLIEKLLTLFKQNKDLNKILKTPSSSNKIKQRIDFTDKTLNKKLQKLVLINSNRTNYKNYKQKNSFKNNTIRAINKHKSISECDLLDKLEHKLYEDFKNTTLKIFEAIEGKMQKFINSTENKNQNSNKNLEKIIESKFKFLQTENLRLKKLIYNNEIKPLLSANFITNASFNEINFLNFEEKLTNISQQIQTKKTEEFKEKTINEIKKNSALTRNLVQNISEIKTIISKENNDSMKNLNKMLNNIRDKVQSIDIILENKFHRVSEFISNQEKINNSTKEFFRKEEHRRSKITKRCFNGFLLNETHCQCLPGFTGENCEIILNCGDNCSKNGVCHYGKCFCNPGFSGQKCEWKTECPVNCNNKGKCHLGKCYCDYGFSGEKCENKISCKNDCSRKGICFRGKCLCEPGWSGEDCSILAVKFNGCRNDCNKNGVCRIEKCFCFPGFSGKYCEVKNKFACPSSVNLDNAGNSTSSENKTYLPCSGNGLCKYGMCFCYPGFKGKACENKEICRNNCSNNGICIQGKCLCKYNIKTDDCSIQQNENLINSPNFNEFRKLKNSTTIKNENKEIFDFHFIQIDKEKAKMNSFQKLDLDVKKAIKDDRENEMLKDSFNNSNMKKEDKSAIASLSIIDEKTGIKYQYNPEGIYIGKETIETIIYTVLIFLLLICSIILTMYLNKKFSK